MEEKIPMYPSEDKVIVQLLREKDHPLIKELRLLAPDDPMKIRFGLVVHDNIRPPVAWLPGINQQDSYQNKLVVINYHEPVSTEIEYKGKKYLIIDRSCVQGSIIVKPEPASNPESAWDLADQKPESIKESPLIKGKMQAMKELASIKTSVKKIRSSYPKIKSSSEEMIAHIEHQLKTSVDSIFDRLEVLQDVIEDLRC